ncbi:MAG: undecaprenyldiphospho-muramoylpentapeptide beta-N-acetylglucosaminyltransferase [Verrucomicrobiota bacterium]|nr:undecaprenyldiphospho-muramoylpentapeptide beta-N-acetylglucosaminyltransferase [Verrucomicrobiota bacterium]
MEKSFSDLENKRPHIAIACGGTGGHLFPGLAVAEELARRDCSVTLLISPKEVDQQAVKSLRGIEVATLPAVGLSGKNFLKFIGGFCQSYQASKKLFQKNPPQAVLAMGGFTSAPPIFAAKKFGAKTFLHESNTIPGRANRWLAYFVDDAFVYFHEASGRMNRQKIQVTGMPVRPQFLDALDNASARIALGLNPDKPVLLLMGGSQGARGINDLVLAALPTLKNLLSELQFVHLTGANDFEKIKLAYAAQNSRAIVRPFLTEMEMALGAATLAVSRSGASSLAELAAMRLPAILIPYPTAADDHQFYNALAFEKTGAARIFEQHHATPAHFAQEISELISNENSREKMRSALAQWNFPQAAEKIAERILAGVAAPQPHCQLALNKNQPGSEIFSNEVYRGELKIKKANA